MHEHLIFYDGTCGLCHALVRKLIQWDKKQLFLFAPLQGKTAKEQAAVLEVDFPSDSVVLIESYQLNQRRCFFRAKAVLSICWLLGGGWTVLGLLSFLPACFFDWAYGLVAQNRGRLFSKEKCPLASTEYADRFLD